MITRFIILATIFSGLSVSESYRILALFPFPGRSHFHVLSAIAKTLALRGHQVDVISPFKLEESFPNYTELEYPALVSHARLQFNETSSSEALKDWVTVLLTEICNVLGHPTIVELIKNPPTNPPYDAVIVHMAVGAQCSTAIGYMLGVPVIGVSTSVVFNWFRHSVGSPLNLAITPGHSQSKEPYFSFWDRLQNVVNTHSQLRVFKGYDGMQESFIKKYLGSDSPSLSDLRKSIALILSNTHNSFYGIKPETPAIVEIGGIHIKNETTKLSPSLKKVLDESVNGFIYFSFGTLTVLESLPTDFSKIIFNTFCKLSPIRVIMRVPNPDFIPENLCKNIFTFVWLPQQKLLEHPNIKAFVTHGGGLSSQETIHFAVPIICIPIFADQSLNCDIFSLKNMGVKIDIRTAKQKDYDNAFQEILSNPKYKDTMKKFSQLYWDRPQSPQEAVNYWVEYVIRHGKNVLRSPAVDLEWWQFDLIDVYFFLFLCFTVATVCAIVIITYTLKLLLRLSVPIGSIKSSKKLE